MPADPTLTDAAQAPVGYAVRVETTAAYKKLKAENDALRAALSDPSLTDAAQALLARADEITSESPVDRAFRVGNALATHQEAHSLVAELADALRAALAAASPPAPAPTCDRAGCFDRAMVPVPGMAADLYECPACGAMADTAPTTGASDV